MIQIVFTLLTIGTRELLRTGSAILIILLSQPVVFCVIVNNDKRITAILCYGLKLYAIYVVPI